MMRYNQTGILMMQDCPREDGFRRRVRQAEIQRKHGVSLRCGIVFVVCFGEQSSPHWCLSNCPGGSKQRFIFQTISQGKRNLHFWTISPKLLKELNLYWTFCRRERKRRCTRSMVMSWLPREAWESPNNVAGADNIKKGIFLCFCFLKTCWVKK